MSSRLGRFVIAVAVAVSVLAAAVAAGWGARKAVPPEAYDFAVERGILTVYPDGKFHPKRVVKRGELAVAIYRTAEALVRDERLRGPLGPPGPAATDTDIARVIERFAHEIKNELTDIEDDVADLQDDTHEFGGRTATLEKSLTGMRNDYRSLERRIARVEAALQARQEDIAPPGATPEPQGQPTP